MTDLAIEPQSSTLYDRALPISDEDMEVKRKALEILVAPSEPDRIPVPNHLLQSSKNSRKLNSIHFPFCILNRTFP